VHRIPGEVKRAVPVPIGDRASEREVHTVVVEAAHQHVVAHRAEQVDERHHESDRHRFARDGRQQADATGRRGGSMRADRGRMSRAL
jgi:hypothetical protein